MLSPLTALIIPPPFSSLTGLGTSCILVLLPPTLRQVFVPPRRENHFDIALR